MACFRCSTLGFSPRSRPNLRQSLFLLNLASSWRPIKSFLELQEKIENRAVVTRKIRPHQISAFTFACCCIHLRSKFVLPFADFTYQRLVDIQKLTILCEFPWPRVKSV
jgi:hypothetical protein